MSVSKIAAHNETSIQTNILLPLQPDTFKFKEKKNLMFELSEKKL